MNHAVTLRWTLLAAAILAFIIVPFLLFGARLESWCLGALVYAEAHPARAAFIVSLLLTADVVLPVPSSVISMGGGALLGSVGGTVASTVGMTMGCLGGYGLGALARGSARRLVTETNLSQMEGLAGRFGSWAVVIARPIPVLAEASVLIMGMNRAPLPGFLLMTTAANMGISVMYATMGAVSVSAHGFALAFTGSILLPGGMMLASRLTAVLNRR